MRTIFHSLPVILLSTGLLFTGCETPGEGAKHGAMIGAGIGAISEGTLRGAAIGAGIGAAAGALAGHINKEERESRYHEQYPEDATYTGEPYGSLPYAELTDEPGFVRSPFRPYHRIDVRGIPHGSKVMDPSCNRIFINP